MPTSLHPYCHPHHCNLKEQMPLQKKGYALFNPSLLYLCFTRWGGKKHF